jgi:hypothetical protein
MEIVIDGSIGLVAHGPTFRDVLETVRREVSGRRRIVVSFSLDGEVLGRERLETLSKEAPAAGALLEVRTADPFKLALETLTGLRGHLANLEKTLDGACRQYQAGEYTKTLEKLEECFHGWEILIRAVRDVGTLAAADFFDLATEGESVDMSIRRLQASLLRFETAIETKDVPRLNEIARTELLPQVARWRAVVSILDQHVARESGEPS